MLSCSKTNINLKKIAVKYKIDKRLTFLMRRHTYASVVALSKGVPIDTVSELLSTPLTKSSKNVESHYPSKDKRLLHPKTNLK